MIPPIRDPKVVKFMELENTMEWRIAVSYEEFWI